MGSAQCNGQTCCAEGNVEEKATMARIRSQSAWSEDVVESGSPGADPSAAMKPLVGEDAPAKPALAGEGDGEEVPPGSTFQVTIERSPADVIGINLDVTDGVALQIVDILPGAVQAWNESRSGQTRLQVHDRIIEANGANGDSDVILAALKQSLSWHLIVQRPVEIRATVDRDGTSSLGMDLRYAPNGSSLMILKVEAGPIQDWNSRPQAYKISKFDRIVEVNGRRGTSKDLLDAGKELDQLKMVVLHYE